MEGTDDKCRICLSRKLLVSIFDCQQNISYAEMLSLVAHLRVEESDGCSKICCSCCKQLEESYIFILLILKSDDMLQKSSKSKKICFSNFKDICFKFDMDLTPVVKKEEFTDFEILENEMYYCDTLIKRLPVIDEGKSSMNVLDFCNKLEDDYNCYNSNDDIGSDKDYHPEESDNEHYLSSKPKWKPKSKNKIGRPRKFTNDNVKEVNIKPVYIRDIIMKPSERRRKKGKKLEKPKRVRKPVQRRICPQCGVLTTNLDSHLIIHIERVKNVACDKCNKMFFTEKSLELHKLRYHPENKELFKCEHCIASFGNKRQLEQHILSHSTVRNQVCPVCNKTFKLRSTMLRHMLLKHDSSGRNKFQCSICPFAFPEARRLRDHMRVHTGERPYKCELCSQPYSYKRDFNRHCLKKHGVSLKRRDVRIMDAEVLDRERRLMHEVLQGSRVALQPGGAPLNPFEGPNAALAYYAVLEDLKSDIIPNELKFTDIPA